MSGVLSREKGLELDEDAVSAEVGRRQGGKGKALSGEQGLEDVYFELSQQVAPEASTFCGYSEVECEASILAITNVT